MTGLIKLIFFVVILTLVRMVLSRLFSKKPAGPSRVRGTRKASATISGKMMKDPQCGTYVASELAVSRNIAGETVYFCSKECMEKYLKLDRHKAPA